MIYGHLPQEEKFDYSMQEKLSVACGAWVDYLLKEGEPASITSLQTK